MALKYLLLVIFTLIISEVLCSKVRIENNGYKGLVVAINPSIEENEELLDAIKESFTSASSVLFKATQHRVYFSEITILVPKSWTNKTREPTFGEKYNQADIIIAPPNPSQGNGPYTVQYGGCGNRGQYIHLTPNYLLEEEAVTNYGPRGKAIVHEWGHLRWGIFDETSDNTPFYWDSEYHNNPIPTGCPKELVGNIGYPGYGNVYHSETGEGCEPDYVNGGYPDDCVYIPPEDSASAANVSLMSYQYLEEVTTFCHDDGGINQHNSEAPNDHNRLCGRRSTWSVILDSLDFKDSVNESLDPSTNTTPIFKTVQVPSSQRFVLVLDVSGSMGGQKLVDMRTAANYFIMTAAPNGSQVGIVEFESDSEIRSYLTTINSQQDRQELSDYLPDSAYGGTSIGDGIYAGTEVLEDNGEKAAGGYLIVLTDGEENAYRMIADVYDDTVEKNIVVHAIMFATQANEILVNLTRDTKGQWFYNDDLSGLMETFNQAGEVDDGDVNNMNFQIQSESFALQYGEEYESIVYIDSTIGQNTVFTFTWSQNDQPPNIVITSPTCSYTNYDDPSVNLCTGNPIHEVSNEFFTVRFLIPGLAETGKWTYRVTPSSNYLQEINAIVSSMAAPNGSEPIIVKSGMSDTNIADDMAAIIYAQVTQGYNPVLGATVVATVDKPSGNSSPIQLLDNGAGADIHLADGIYSRYFTDFVGEGRYSVQVKVSHNKSINVNSSSTSRASYRGGVVTEDGTFIMNPNGAKSPEATSDTTGVQSEEIGQFSRETSGGAFSYSGTGTTVDGFPPNQITDMTTKQSDLTNFTKGVIISFTAPGNDYDSGTASRYEIRYTYEEPTNLIRNFSGNMMITDSDVISGKLTNPSPAGATETITVRTPDLPEDQDDIRLAFAARAYDEVGNVANPSNVPVLKFFIAPLVAPTTAVPTTETCNPHTELYQLLTVVFGGLTTALLTSTIILSVWLSKSNKQLKEKRDAELRGYDNIRGPNNENYEDIKNHVPVISKTTQDGRSGMAYIPRSEMHYHLPRVNEMRETSW